MLESPGLLLGSWQRPPQTVSGGPAPGLFRWVLDARSRQPLGLIRSKRSDRGPLWRWLERQVWQVFETEDESLLLTLYGPWSFLKPWEVHDAEDRLICTMASRAVLDSAGDLRAYWTGPAPPGHYCFRDAADRELAQLHSSPDGLELLFTALIQDDPYAKMALLGATLVLSEQRRLGKAG
jgi:hypothetical protein